MLPLVFYLTKTTVLPLMYFFMTTNKKQQCYPLCFFSWRPIKNDSVTPCGFFHDDQRKTTVLPPMFYLINIDSVTPYVYFMTADKKRQCYPLCFIWQRQQCYPLCFFSRRPIKDDIVTPCVFFHDDQRRTTVLPPMFFFNADQ